MHSSLFWRVAFTSKDHFCIIWIYAWNFTSLSSNPAAANSKPEAKKRSQSNNPTRTWRSLVNQPVPFPEKNGVPKKHPLGFGGFFFGGHIPASPMPIWHEGPDAIHVSRMRVGVSFWSINFDKKTWVRQVFSKEKLLGLWLWYSSWGWISHELSTHPCHISLLSLWVWILYSWYSYVCTIHFYAGTYAFIHGT